MRLLSTLLLLAAGATAFAQTASKPATEATRRANAAMAQQLDFADRQDFEDAKRGLLARPDTLTIKGEKGNVVWDMEQYKAYIGDDKPAPDTVNPSLWRNAQLNMHHGLFEVVPGIYQVRGYDLSNITFIRGKTGWIVGDPISTSETSKAAYELVTRHFGRRPVVAVIYSHSHGDHFGGVRGIVDEKDVRSGKVKIVAPDHFTEEAVSEGVIAGNAMGRRGVYMYGPFLPRNATGGVNGGLGQTIPAGTVGMLAPTDIVRKTGEKRTIDGVEIVFQVTPGTEAPAEMNAFLPQFKAMWMAENATHTLHNLLTLRGAQVRNGLTWSKFLNETIELFGPRIEAEFASHHWPMWGNARILEFLGKQRDLYKYIHDQSVFLMNQGYTGTEIAEMIKLPPELDRAWYNRGYYGTVKHNARAVYQRYMGWYVPGLELAGPDTVRAMAPDLVFDYWGVRLDRGKAAGKKLLVGFNFTDLKKEYALSLQNGVLTQSQRRAASPDARLVLTKAAFDRLQTGEATLEQAIASGDVKVEGRREAATDLMGAIATFPFWFNIVTP